MLGGEEAGEALPSPGLLFEASRHTWRMKLPPELKRPFAVNAGLKLPII